jgi:hypothetical protein
LRCSGLLGSLAAGEEECQYEYGGSAQLLQAVRHAIPETSLLSAPSLRRAYEGFQNDAAAGLQSIANATQ